MSYLKGDNWMCKILTKIRSEFNLYSVDVHKFYCCEWEISETCQGQGEGQKNASNSSQTTPPQKVSCSYLIYRFVFMVILLSCITFSTSCQPYLFHIFLTNWSFMSQNVYGVIFFLSVFHRWVTFRRGEQEDQKKNGSSSASLLTLNHKSIMLELDLGGEESVKKELKRVEILENKNPPELQRHRQPDVELGLEKLSEKTSFEKPQVAGTHQHQVKLTWLEKSLWVLINVVHVLPYCVVLGYWCVVYKYDPNQPSCEKFKSHYIVHGATAVLALVDQLVIAIPARPSHCLIPTGLVLFYVLFTCLYEAGGGFYRPGQHFIYSVLDWRNGPKKAVIFSALAVIVTPFAHTLFCYGVYKLRMGMKSFYLRGRKQPFFNSQ